MPAVRPTRSPSLLPAGTPRGAHHPRNHLHGGPNHHLHKIACSFGDTVLPEVQATVKAPAKRNMYKGISLCYTIITVTYLLVAITGE